MISYFTFSALFRGIFIVCVLPFVLLYILTADAVASIYALLAVWAYLIMLHDIQLV